MSTFGGFMPEFPHIRVDFFRPICGYPPPLACFLSHVHSDHLAGLESLRSPFIYCSAATKSLLLRLEKYSHWLNYERGILESRKQHFKHLKKLLKPIPLHTPTRIELAPGVNIQATLFDANHCTGAVMFLIEGNGHAVLYTGDVRAEPWFVNALARNPCIVEYTSGLKTLDCIYLDTSFTENIAFPTKAEGLAELLQKVSKYPSTTQFHFSAWTFGYEDVWMALSRSLKSQVHVDKYRMRLYESLRYGGDGDGLQKSCLIPEAPILAGYKVGNTEHPGILTLDPTVRIHSCERGTKCDHLGDQTVWIKPIIARTLSGQEICEIGVGGGGGDLNQRLEIELDSDETVAQFMQLLELQSGSALTGDVRRMLLAGLQSSQKALILNVAESDFKRDNLSLDGLANILVKYAACKSTAGVVNMAQQENFHLPKCITFPYSRHSSYFELCDLVRIFKPMDVYPCTVDKANWHEGASMRNLFGVLCSTSIFRHDQEMRDFLSDPYEDKTQKSWNGFDEDDPRTSSEDGDSQHDVSCSGYKDLTQGLKKEFTADSATTDVVVSKTTQNDACTEKVTFTEVDSYNRFEAFSDPPCLALAQSLSSSQESERHSLRRRINLEEELESVPKRPRLRGNDTSIKLQPFFCKPEATRAEEAIQPANIAVAGLSYYDAHDDVSRCEAYGWEFERPQGTCTGCGAGEPGYYEVDAETEGEDNNEDAELNPNPRFCKHHPRIYVSANPTEDDGPVYVKASNPVSVTGNYLDGASAYDSASDGAGDEYESSFIDDSPSDIENQKQTNSAASDDLDSCADYEELGPRPPPENRIDNDIEVTCDVLGSYSHGPENPDESDFKIVDSKVKDSLVSEEILSQVQGDSQSSTISPSRLKSRVDAFLAATEDWHNISLMCTGDNHADESQEL